MNFFDSVNARNVFEHDLDAGMAYRDAARAAALLQIRTAVGDGGVAVLCTGAPGIGKTTFLASLAEELSANRSAGAGNLQVFACGPDRGLAAILAAHAGATGHALNDEHSTGSPTRWALLLDDVDRLAGDEVERLVQWWTSVGAKPGSSALVMTSAPSRPLGFRSRAMSQLLETVDRIIELKPFSRADSEKLIQNQLAAAGYVGPAPFTEAALDQIAFYGNGNPQRILQLCAHVIGIASAAHDFPASVDCVKRGAHDLFLPKRLRELARAGGPRPLPATPPEGSDVAPGKPPHRPPAPPARPAVPDERVGPLPAESGRRKLRLSPMALGLAMSAFAIGVLGGVSTTLFGEDEPALMERPSVQPLPGARPTSDSPAKQDVTATQGPPALPAVLQAGSEPPPGQVSGKLPPPPSLDPARRQVPSLASATPFAEASPAATTATALHPPPKEAGRQAPRPPPVPVELVAADAPPPGETANILQAPLAEVGSRTIAPGPTAAATNSAETVPSAAELATLRATSAATPAPETSSPPPAMGYPEQSAMSPDRSAPSGGPSRQTDLRLAEAESLTATAPTATVAAPATELANRQANSSYAALTAAEAGAPLGDRPAAPDPEAEPRSTLDVAPPQSASGRAAGPSSMNAGPGTDTTIATLQPAPATTLAPPQFLDYGPHVREAQVHLAQLGFGPGPIDGLLGPRTATAIRAFQQAKGLEATGSLTTTVVSALRSDVAGRGIRPRSGAAAPATPVERGAEIQSDASHLANPVAQSCRGNQGKWIYVEEFKRYVYCGAFSEGIVR